MVSRLAVLLTCTVVVPAFAQDQPAPEDSLRFRRGQWAAHFALGSFGGVGVSRFRSPSRALFFQLNVSASHAEQVAEDSVFGRRVVVQSNGGVTARMGWRRYRAVSSRITPYTTVGPAFGLSHSYGRQPSAASSSDTWSLGVFGDLGALYHVTRSLTLGAAGSGEVRYSRNASRSSPSGARSTYWELQLSGVTIGAGLTLLF